MNDKYEIVTVCQAVLKAMYDLTREKWNPEIPMPTRNELAQRVGIGIEEAANSLEYLAARRLVKVEELGDDGSPNYSITQAGEDQIENAPEVVKVSPQAERQPLVRDMELVRALLLYIAENSHEHQYIEQPTAEGYSEEVVTYHLSIMHQAGLIKAGKMGSRWGLGTLTWEGQDFLSAASNDQAWNKVKKTVGGAFGTLTLGVVKDLVVKEMRNQLGLP